MRKLGVYLLLNLLNGIVLAFVIQVINPNIRQGNLIDLVVLLVAVVIASIFLIILNARICEKLLN